MLEFYDPRLCLPSSEELPDSDETPVDKELQDLMPGLLKAILAQIWADRQDWFFGVDMGIYYDPEESAIVPNGFLSRGVERIVDEELRLSYVLWEEQNIVPVLVMEVVSRKYRGEYSSKKPFMLDGGEILRRLFHAPPPQTAARNLPLARRCVHAPARKPTVDAGNWAGAGARSRHVPGHHAGMAVLVF